MSLLQRYLNQFDTSDCGYQPTDNQEYNNALNDISGKVAAWFFGFYVMPIIFLMLSVLIFMAVDPFGWFTLSEVSIDWSRW